MFENKIHKLKKANPPLYRMPKSAQETIDVKRISEDGIFELIKSQYSKSYEISDINYSIEAEEEQTNLLVGLTRLYHTIPVSFQITINNKNYNMQELEEEYYYHTEKPELKKWAEAYNEIIQDSIRRDGRPGISQEKYLTVTVRKNNGSEAAAFFQSLETTMRKEFKRLGSEILPMDAKRRLQILHDVYRIGREEEYDFDYAEYVRHGWDWKNDVAEKITFFPTAFQIGEKYGRVMYVRKIGSSLSDQFITELSQTPMHSMISIHAVPIPKEVAAEWIDRNYMSVEKKIQDQQESRNRRGNYSSDISYVVQQEKEEVGQALSEITKNDQKLFWVHISILLLADSKEELAEFTENVRGIARSHSILVDIYDRKQREAFQTVLPVGVREVGMTRTMLSRELAVLEPFYVQDLSQRYADFYGRNQVSKAPVSADRKRLANPHGWIFGETGSGKTVFNRLEMLSNVLRNPEETHILIDPQNEYFDWIRLLGGTVVNLSAQAQTYVNPLDASPDLPRSERRNLIARKSQLMLSLAQEQYTEELNPHHKSLIDRCVERVYREYFRKKTAQPPTLVDFYELLSRQEEEEARDLALAFEIFVKGSLNLFAHQSNLDLEKQILCFGLAELGEDLASMAMLIMLDAITRKVNENFSRGLATHIRIDEIHVLLEHEITASYLDRAWKMFRKKGGIITGMTQNISYIARSPIGSDMLSNSKFVVMLDQSINDAKVVADMIGISEAQLQFATGTEPGMGLLKYGSKVVPFENRLRKENLLYQAFNSNFHEIHRTEGKG